MLVRIASFALNFASSLDWANAIILVYIICNPYIAPYIQHMLLSFFILSYCRSPGYDSLVYLRSASDVKDKCRLLKSKTDCLARYGKDATTDGKHDYSRPSCVWHHLRKKDMVESYRMTSWGSNAMVSRFATGAGRLKFRGTLCRLTVTATLPNNSLNAYGAYISLEGGPRYSLQYSSNDMSEPGRDATITGCAILPASEDRSCKVSIVPPVGYAKDRRFRNSSLNIDFFTTDPNRIYQLKTNQQLSPSKTMVVDVNYKWNRCPKAVIATLNSTQVPIVDDTIVFGPTDFSLKGLPLSTQMKQYYMVSYRTYTIINVTEVRWKVEVGDLLDEADLEATPLTVFLAQQRRGFYFGFDCADKDPDDNTMCLPPRDYRVKGTPVCVGTVCQGSAGGLNPKEQYVLFVSYPTYRDPLQYNASFSQQRIVTPYTREEVHVRLWAVDWSLGKFLGRSNDETEEV